MESSKPEQHVTKAKGMHKWRHILIYKNTEGVCWLWAGGNNSTVIGDGEDHGLTEKIKNRWGITLNENN